MDISNIVKNEVRNKDLASEIQLVTEKGIANALHDLYLSIINLNYAPKSSVYTKQETNTLLGNKQDVITGAASTVINNNLNADSVIVSNSSGKITTSSITKYELEYLDNCVDNVQEQLNAKQNTLTFDSTPINNSTNPVTSDGIYDALSLKENLSNKVTSISSSSTDTQYPSAKLLYDKLATKQDTLTFDNTPTENSNNPVKSGGVYSYLSQTCPVGTVLPFLGSSIPEGFLLCDGSGYSSTYYGDLHRKIGTTYGSGNGTTTDFNVPDFRNKTFWGGTTSNVGTNISAGLPNITGTAGRFLGNVNDITYIHTGAFKSSTQQSFLGASTGGSDDYINANFSAADGEVHNGSYSNQIYGKSDTVQPPAIQCLFIIKY